jgi:alkylation response protein AidB-like acyl-CoA dehydrogenase
MRWELSSEQDEFRAVLRDWLSNHCGRSLRSWLDTGEPRPFEERFVADGWFAVGSPEELGGQGGDLVELALVAEELGRSAAPSSAWLGSVLTVPFLAEAPDQAKELLADGVITALAVDGTTPPAAPTVRDDGAGLVGTVSGVVGADRARRLVVPVLRAGRVLSVLIETDTPGVRMRARALVDRTRTVADVLFDGARGTELPGDGAVLVRDAALRAAVLVAADSLGAAERMLDLAVTYSLQRNQFGVPIGSFQAVKHAAAEMLVQVESARSIVFLAAASVAAGHPDASLHAAAAKAQVTAGGARTADSALTVHGAIGYTWEHDLQLFYKRAKLDQVLFGAPAVWNDRLADELKIGEVRWTSN